MTQRVFHRDSEVRRLTGEMSSDRYTDSRGLRILDKRDWREGVSDRLERLVIVDMGLIQHVVPFTVKHRVERVCQIGILLKGNDGLFGVIVGGCSTLKGVQVGSRDYG